MKKAFAIIPIAIFFVLLSSAKPVFASTYYDVGYCVIKQYDSYIPPGLYTLYCADAENARYPFSRYNQLYLKVGSSGGTGFDTYIFDPNANTYKPVVIGRYLSIAYIDQDTIPSNQFTGSITLNSSGLGTSVIYADYDDFMNEVPDEYKPVPPEDPTWYDQLFQDFIDYIGAGITGGVEGFIDWLTEAWTYPVGEGENELSFETISPTPTPTPIPSPTPIPYQTQLTPDGNGGYNITYIYVNPSGVPTSGPMPPTNPPSGLDPVDYDNFEYPYYNNPVNSDDPYELDIPWYLKFKFKGVTTSLNDFQTGIDETVDMVNDNQENIDIVMDSVGLFPSDWLIIFGFIGAIPLVGGIISRLLKG